MGNKSSNSRARGPQQYQAMVEDAVSALKEHPGSTQADIFKYLENKYSGRITPKVRKILQNVLKSVIRTKPVHRGPRSLARGSKMKRKPVARGGAPRGRGGGQGRASAGRKAGPGGGRNLKKVLIKKKKPSRGNVNKKQKVKSRNLKMSGRKLKLSSRGNGPSSRKTKPVLKKGAKTVTRSYHKSERPGRPSAPLNPRLARDSSRASGRASGRASNRASARPSRHNSSKSKLGRGGQRHRSVKVVTCCQRRVVSGRGRH